MLLSVAVGGVVIAGGSILLRRRISKNWITRSNLFNKRLSKESGTIIITGGNIGLGYAAAQILAEFGGKILLACRDIDAGERAALAIRSATGNADVRCALLDLSSLESVRTFASALTLKNERIFALVCNAGVWIPSDGKQQQTKTQDGYEIHFGVNHLGHFALIQSLVPQLVQSNSMDHTRIVIVSSSLCKSGKIDLTKRDFIYNARKTVEESKSFAPPAYCDSKLINLLTCRELAVRLKGTNVTTYAVSPGFCRSQLGRNVKFPFFKKMLAVPMMRLVQRTPEQGALNIVHAVMGDKDAMESGAMYQDGKIWDDGVTLVKTLDASLQKGVWDISEELLKANPHWVTKPVGKSRTC
jgi:NAD(P)-dependent dehydrogenase (short-subunit alcohol dehydrogenase family)